VVASEGGRYVSGNEEAPERSKPNFAHRHGTGKAERHKHEDRQEDHSRFIPSANQPEWNKKNDACRHERERAKALSGLSCGKHRCQEHHRYSREHPSVKQHCMGEGMSPVGRIDMKFKELEPIELVAISVEYLGHGKLMPEYDVSFR
jgi:hypothetical protein